ncbi:MAG: CPBP family intramembrane metalloprotease [Myxococcales bacterium]|nr:CPBP family intramembrane metalloprotease [Myxococcales bacterium]MCB9668174.1 CPBP family intramembrane metalloprotease [Alphaproteobacteria bacterium]MCB9692513.1 CPBP family intramembrane metalloprotease [Alphaproteobacteria bacterium]
MPDSIQTDPETRAEVVHAGVAFLAATVGWLLLGGLITAVIAAALRPDPSMPLEVAARLPAALALGAVLQTGGTLAVVLLLLRAFGRPASSAPARPVQVGLAALTGLTVGLLPGWIADRLRELAPSGESLLTVLQHTLPDAGLGPRLGLVLAICVLAPIAEELAFRGFLWTHLRRALSAPATLAITSVVFLLFHLDRLQTPSLLPTALLLGFLRWRTGSVLPAIAAHAANNVVGMVVLLALDPDRTPSIPLWSATLGTLASWSVALLPWLSRRGPDADVPPAPGPHPG